MATVRQTETFSAWLRNLRDIRARAKIVARIQRLETAIPATSYRLAMA
jgi:putative component of toxin-antitoxin plasmid stabilization module